MVDVKDDMNNDTENYAGDPKNVQELTQYVSINITTSLFRKKMYK